MKEKMNNADPVLSAIIRGLSLGIGDANDLAEKYWLELNIYKSLKRIKLLVWLKKKQIKKRI